MAYGLPFSIGAGDHDARAEEPITGHLRKAEVEIAWLRWIGLVGWFFVLWYEASPVVLPWAWLVYAGGIAYAAIAQWRLTTRKPILVTAWTTTIGDPLLTAFMCTATGGLHSVFFPFFYFTLLAAAFRFGARETAAMLAFTAALTILVFVMAPVADDAPEDLVIVLFYLAFSAALGGMLARWARENLDLALTRAHALRLARDRSRVLLRRLIGAEEEERRRIAGELHDRMGGRLFTLQHGLDRSAGEAAGDASLKSELDALCAEARACSDDVRTMMNELRPTVLDDLGFCEAVRDHAARIAESAEFDVAVRVDPALEGWRGQAETMLFRIVQELLLNVRKHASARHVAIEFSKTDERIRLSVEDDGCGFENETGPSGHFGLLTIRERAEALGGEMDVRSAPGTGARITVDIPEEMAEPAA